METLIFEEVDRAARVVQCITSILLFLISYLEICVEHNKRTGAQVGALGLFMFINTFTNNFPVRLGFSALMMNKLIGGTQNFLIEFALLGRATIENRLREHGVPKLLSCKTVALFSEDKNYLQLLFQWKTQVHFNWMLIGTTIMIISPMYAQAVMGLAIVFTRALYLYEKKNLPPITDPPRAWPKELLLFTSETVGFIVSYLTFPKWANFLELYIYLGASFLITLVITISLYVIHYFLKDTAGLTV